MDPFRSALANHLEKMAKVGNNKIKQDKELASYTLFQLREIAANGGKDPHDTFAEWVQSVGAFKLVEAIRNAVPHKLRIWKAACGDDDLLGFFEDSVSSFIMTHFPPTTASQCTEFATFCPGRITVDIKK